jgi:Ca2+-transporting ATPase
LIVWILIGAGLVSGFLGEWVDSIAILSIVFLNGLIGFYQEYNAEKSIAALKKMTAPQAKVRRDGKVVLVPAADVVPGDVIELEAGDLVPADARLIEAASLKNMEAALTGESESVTKRVHPIENDVVPLGDQKNMVFMGTSVTSGNGIAVVVATGMATEFGKIAGLLQEEASEGGTPLQQKLQSVGKILVWACLGIVGLIFLLGFLRGLGTLELFLTSVSLAVAAVPEGLPTVVTVALALGVQRMARRRALVRKLPAVETLGSTNVICTDKTGTLTLGEMTVRSLYAGEKNLNVTGEGYGPEGNILFQGKSLDEKTGQHVRQLLTIFVGCNGAHLSQDEDRWKVIGDPTEGALLTAGLKIGMDASSLEKMYPKVNELPFDSERKRMTVIRRGQEGALQSLTKGAPDILLERSTHILTEQGIRPITEEDKQRVTRQINEMAGRALRVLAAAYREPLPEAIQNGGPEEIEREMIFVGLAGMYDPPRPEAKKAVSLCKSAGIRVVMITGDHPQTALAVAHELGIGEEGGQALSGLDLDRLSEDVLRQRIQEISVYARVSAEHKLRIVRAWKTQGAVIAMTGDGVNDAPAIKGADIGIAMGRTGTEVTKEASDMVITDDNFASIVAAVEEGRCIYDNIKKTLQYLLAGNTGEILVMAAAVIGGIPIPLLPIHLLWINLVSDGLPALCLATDPIDSDVMKRHPRKMGEKITDRRFFFRMLFTGLLTAGVSLGAYIFALRRGESLELARTHAFAMLVYAELFRAFGARSDTKPIWKLGLFSNLKLVLVVGGSILIQPWSHHSGFLESFFKASRMDWAECLILMAIGTIPFLVLETLKVIRFRLYTPIS